MYAKLFASILDSSIWLESSDTRVVWFTFLAAKDVDGFARFATVRNVADRAKVSLEAAEEAIRVLESPDPDSSNPDHEGRRIERVPGGWVVLNAKYYDDIVSTSTRREQTRQSVARHRDKAKLEAVGGWQPAIEQELAARLPTEAGRLALAGILHATQGYGGKAAVCARIREMLDGNVPNHHATPEQMDAALFDYFTNTMAAGRPWHAAYFAGCVRRSIAGQITVPDDLTTRERLQRWAAQRDAEEQRQRA